MNRFAEWLRGGAMWRHDAALRRASVMMLALLGLVLALLLVRVYLIQQDNANRLDDIADLLTPVEPGTSASEKAAFLAMQGMADRLGRWLTSGRASTELAPPAIAVGSLVRDYLRAPPQDPRAQFWSPLSARLTELEAGVQTGRIATPEAIALVRSLREDYARLRELAENRSSTPLPNPQHTLRAGEAVMQLTERQQQGARLAGWALLAGGALLGAVTLVILGLRQQYAARVSPVRSQPQNDQAAVLRLLDEMTPLAEGDLRVQATVSEAHTGALADAFNHAVTELRRLVGDIHRSSDAVAQAVGKTRKSSRELAQASAVQAREILRSSNYLNAMSDTMAQLSADAAESTRIADSATLAARQGGRAVRDNLQGLDLVGEMADMTLRLMQRLVENAETINARIVDIQSVARRSDLLALNTTIRAAGGQSVDAGDRPATGDLSRLADDVSDLSEVLGAATRDIGNLTDIIREDAGLTIHSMQRTRDELLTAQSLARDAAAALERIEGISARLQALIDDIASKSLRQAGVVRQLSANMGVINGITHESSEQMQQSAQSLESLHELAETLRRGVAGFQLPASADIRQRSVHTDTQRAPVSTSKA